ncbi:unnamed protein product, partial [marine sediment metagenome]
MEDIEAAPQDELIKMSEESEVEETGALEQVVIPRSPDTEHLFDEDDTESDGVIILSPSSPEEAPLGEEPLDPYVWWNWSGSFSIPDGPSGSWVGIDCNTPTSIPYGYSVTYVRVHHKITHTWIGDLEVKVYNASGHTWMVRDNEGGDAD